MASSDAVTIRRPDDWHVHLRDGEMLETVVPFTARAFARAIVMPNLAPPVTTAAMAVDYRSRIKAAVPPGVDFEPLMTCYLTDGSDAAEIERGHDESIFSAAKLYPAGATTNSALGVTGIAVIDKVLAAMERIGMPLLVHGEVVDPAVDVFDREAVFIERVLRPLTADFPGLRIVFEHITTEEAASFVRESGAQIAATITPHHLAINRNAMFEGGMRPHMYCLPVAKRERHRRALRAAAVSGASCFFLGTDSAPHLAADKETGCGCAGIFNAPVALAAYARVFAEEGALDRLEAFASLNGPRFYGLAPNEDRVTLMRKRLAIPDRIPVVGGGADDAIVPFLAGTEARWTVLPADAPL